MSQLKKHLVCVHFERLIEGITLPSDRVFVVSALSDQAACSAVLAEFGKIESDVQIKCCTSRLLNSVLSNPFYLLESEGGEPCP